MNGLVPPSTGQYDPEGNNTWKEDWTEKCLFRGVLLWMYFCLLTIFRFQGFFFLMMLVHLFCNQKNKMQLICDKKQHRVKRGGLIWALGSGVSLIGI